MPAKLASLLVLSFCLTSCDDLSGEKQAGANPYEEEQREPPPAPPVPRGRQSVRRSTTPSRTRRPVHTPTPSIKVEDAGAHAVPLTFDEYSRMTQRATEMLEELTTIHIAVDESADASPYQDRWGDLTADLTQLYLDALDTGYPPDEIAQRLNNKALPQLRSAIDVTEQTMRNHTRVDSGIDKCYADALAIYEHMHHELPTTE